MWAQAMKSDEANNWRDAAQSEMQNYQRHGVYIEVSEDQLPSWNASTKRAFEVVDMMWVLTSKRDKKEEILRYKARAVVFGNQQKRRTQARDVRWHPLHAPPHSNYCAPIATVRRGMPLTCKDPLRDTTERSRPRST
eukprot:357517-Pleurochrysis_carterae.AAC.1